MGVQPEGVNQGPPIPPVECEYGATCTPDDPCGLHEAQSGMPPSLPVAIPPSTSTPVGDVVTQHKFVQEFSAESPYCGAMVTDDEGCGDTCGKRRDDPIHGEIDVTECPDCSQTGTYEARILYDGRGVYTCPEGHRWQDINEKPSNKGIPLSGSGDGS